MKLNLNISHTSYVPVTLYQSSMNTKDNHSYFQIFFCFFRNQAEMNQTCRGTISLHSALIHTVDSCTFVITNGGTQTFHIKAANEVERQSWVTALELAKAKSM